MLVRHSVTNCAMVKSNMASIGYDENLSFFVSECLYRYVIPLLWLIMVCGIHFCHWYDHIGWFWPWKVMMKLSQSFSYFQESQKTCTCELTQIYSLPLYCVEYPVLAQVEALHTTLAANQHWPEQCDALTAECRSWIRSFWSLRRSVKRSQSCANSLEFAVVSEREGNWNLHVATIEDSRPIFAECDCIN